MTHGGVLHAVHHAALGVSPEGIGYRVHNGSITVIKVETCSHQQQQEEKQEKQQQQEEEETYKQKQQQQQLEEEEETYEQKQQQQLEEEEETYEQKQQQQLEEEEETYEQKQQQANVAPSTAAAAALPAGTAGPTGAAAGPKWMEGVTVESNAAASAAAAAGADGGGTGPVVGVDFGAEMEESEPEIVGECHAGCLGRGLTCSCSGTAAAVVLTGNKTLSSSSGNGGGGGSYGGLVKEGRWVMHMELWNDAHELGPAGLLEGSGFGGGAHEA